MTTKARRAKDPDANVPYTIDWTHVCEGAIITSSTWVVDMGLDVGVESHDDTSATVWLSGGVDGDTYEVDNVVTFSDGRTDSRSFYIYVKNRPAM